MIQVPCVDSAVGLKFGLKFSNFPIALHQWVQQKSHYHLINKPQYMYEIEPIRYKIRASEPCHFVITICAMFVQKNSAWSWKKGKTFQNHHLNKSSHFMAFLWGTVSISYRCRCRIINSQHPAKWWTRRNKKLYTCQYDLTVKGLLSELYLW